MLGISKPRDNKWARTEFAATFAAENLAGPRGFEPLTVRLRACCSRRMLFGSIRYLAELRARLIDGSLLGLVPPK